MRIMSGSHWTVERVLLILTFSVSVLAFVFGIGVQWAKTTAVELRVSAIDADYVSREVYAADQRRLSESIDRLTEILDKLLTQQGAN